MAGEASSHPSKGWRVSDSSMGIVLKVHRLRLGALKPLGCAMKYGAKDNEIANRIRGSQGDFLMSPEWRAMRRRVVDHYGRACMKCGTTPKNQRHTHVDHVKPRTRYPELKLDFSNLQVLCCRCNKAKGNKIADYRQESGTL